MTWVAGAASLRTRSICTGSEEQISPSTLFLQPSTRGVPRGRGVRGAARGLERELKASGRHRKKAQKQEVVVEVLSSFCLLLFFHEKPPRAPKASASSPSPTTAATSAVGLLWNSINQPPAVEFCPPLCRQPGFGIGGRDASVLSWGWEDHNKKIRP